MLWVDTETYSECPIARGTYAYAAHPSTKVLLLQWAVDDGPVTVLDLTADDQRLDEFKALVATQTEVTAHKSDFDRNVLKSCLGIDIPISRWRDTMVQALCHGLPGGLDKLCGILGVATEEAKDKRGRALLMLFCKPRAGVQATRETHPVQWAEFVHYAGRDIVAMRAVAKKLPTWNWRENILAQWHLDQCINDRGVLVDVDLAHAAVAACAQAQAGLRAEAESLTDGEVGSTTQRDKLLVHLLKAHGVVLSDLTAATVDAALKSELPDPVRALLANRVEATRASTAKYRALLGSVSGDGRLRGTLQFSGAARTMRWAGRLFQPQNLMRPTMKSAAIDTAIQLFKLGLAGAMYPNPMTVAANATRGALVAPAGRKLVVADLANIEGRVLAWLAGERWKLKAFAEFDAGRGQDLYKVAYGRSFGVPAETVEDGSAERQIGKVQELMLGYQGGVGAYLTGAETYRIDLDALGEKVKESASAEAWAEAESRREWLASKGILHTHGLDVETWLACQALVLAWRAAHPNTVALWKALEGAAKAACESPGTVFKSGGFVAFRKDGSWLRAALPSGRYVCYCQPKVEDGKLTYLGVDPFTRRWQRLPTYGGKLAENVTQAVARDVLALGMQAAEAEGYEIVLTVHDELITEAPDTEAFSVDRLASLLSRGAGWTAGLPLAAAGFEAYRYRKG